MLSEHDWYPRYDLQPQWRLRVEKPKKAAKKLVGDTLNLRIAVVVDDDGWSCAGDSSESDRNVVDELVCNASGAPRLFWLEITLPTPRVPIVKATVAAP